LALQATGKKCEVVGTHPVPDQHRSMTNRVVMDKVENPIYIAVDSASPQRVGTYADQHFTFCIDHHHNTFEDVDYRYVETDCGACSEIIFKLIKEMKVPITKQIADFLYMAIVTDTMSFRTSDTRVQTFEIATELARLGADTYHISRRFMFLKSKGRIEIEHRLRNSFHFSCGDRVLTGIIMLSDLEDADILDSQLEGINSLVDEVEGVRLGITIRELLDGRMRCSVRTNGDLSADAFCRLHGGGGHFHAACCELDCDAPTARCIMEESARAFLKKHSDEKG
jgi:phosphoesterase RecJ-like protein